MKKVLKLLGLLFALLSGLFAVYYFNLDMKLTAALEPLFLKHYDRSSGTSICDEAV